MPTKSVRRAYFGVPALIVTLSLAAPAALAQKAAEAAEDRQGFRDSVVQIRGQIDTTLQALNKYVESQDASARKSALKSYTSEVNAMGKQVDKTRDYAKKMEERGHAYFKEWEKKMKGVTNEELVASANERRTALQAQYETIENGIAQAKETSSKFWQNLQDLQKFFTSDQSADAITTSAKLVESVNADGKTIQGYIDEIVKAVDAVGTVAEKPPEEAAPEEAVPADTPAEEPPAEDNG